MKKGDVVHIRAEVIDFDSNPHGAAVKVEITGFIDREESVAPFGDKVNIWIHRLDQPTVIAKKEQREVSEMWKR